VIQGLNTVLELLTWQIETTKAELKATKHI
jgi:hypothetical protein